MKGIDLLKQIQKKNFILTNHPCKDLKLEEKIHYLNGLSLIINEDGVVDTKEMEYLTILLNSLDLSDICINDILEYAKDPDESSIMEMLEVLKDEKVRYVFLFDSIVLACIDGDFHIDEKNIILQYASMIGVSLKCVEELESVYQLIKNKDKSAIDDFIYTSDNLKDEYINYLYDFYEVDNGLVLSEKERKILNFNFITPQFAYGGLINGTELMTEAISLEQFCIFLNYMYKNEEILLDEDKNIIYKKDKTIILMRIYGISNIVFFNNKFIANDIVMHNRIVVQPTGALLFIEWLNKVLKTDYKIPYYFGTIEYVDRLKIMNIKNMGYEIYECKNEFYQSSSNYTSLLDISWSTDIDEFFSLYDIELARTEVNDYGICFRLMK